MLNTKTAKILYRGLMLISVLALLTSCSRKKNKWVNRNFHAMGTYYNILYHGNLALEEGKTQIRENYEEDYWETLPIERLDNTDDPIVYGQMVEVPPAVMPRRPEPVRKEEGEKRNKTKPTERTLENAFSDFDQGGITQNTGSNRYGQNERGYDQGNQYGNNPMGGRNQNNQYGNNPMGGRTQNNQYGNNQMGGRNQGGQYGSNNIGGQNQGGQFGNNQMGGQNQGGQFGNNNMGGRNQGGQYGSNQMGGQNQGGQFGNNNMGGRNQGGMSRGNNQMGGRNQQAPNANTRGNLQRGSVSYQGNDGLDGEMAGRTDRVEMSSSEAFASAEEKAAKGIQKHNMLIKGEEYNPLMKDAFLLLGKSRYYQKRYFPALEAFNYILSKYDDEKIMASAEIWREKTYMRLENYDRVIKNLGPVVFEPSEELSQEDIVDAATALAQAYYNTDEKEEALKVLNIAIRTTKDKGEKGRFHYIKGQIFQSMGQIDSSNTSFTRVIKLNRNSPRDYMINAYMEKAKNFDYKTGDKEALLDTLNRLLVDRENRPYKDIINYRIAEYHKDLDDMPSAIVAYNKSLRTGTTNHGLRKRIYQTLGNYNFDKARYKEAGAYYDSTMVNMPEVSLEYRRMKRKRLSLNDVIMYEEVAKVNDSILALVDMSDTERRAYFQKHVDTLKEKAIADAEKALKENKRASLPPNMFNRQRSQAGGSGTFYFYDERQKERGVLAFKQIWGERALQDNWRFERGRAETERGEKDTKKDSKADYLAMIEADPTYQVDTYMEQIPTDPDFIDELIDDRNFSYYQLGVIYHEKFSEYELAAGKLESLLEKKPEERLVLPAKYNLYKIYLQLGKNVEAEKWKNDVIKNHPDSRYAKILLNPESLKEDETNPIQIYNALYKDYKADRLEKVIEEATEYAEIFIGHAMVPKFELLKATAIGRLYGFEPYAQSLDYIALAYPQSEEGKQAEKIIQEVLPKISQREFDMDFKEEMKFNLVYPMAATDRDQAEELKAQLGQAIEDYEEKGLTTTIDVYSPDVIFVVVKGLGSKVGAEGFGAKVRKDKDYKIDKDNFGVSTGNYEVILMHKRLEDYRQQLN